MLPPESIEQIEQVVRGVVREELERHLTLRTRPTSVALTLRDAATATGYSLEGIRQAIRRNELVPSYANSKPVLMVEELVRWLRSLPDEPRRL